MNTQFINVLISSVSRKVPLVKAVRRALEKVGVEGKIIGADADSECIGGYFVDQFWKMPLQMFLRDVEASNKPQKMARRNPYSVWTLRALACSFRRPRFLRRAVRSLFSRSFERTFPASPGFLVLFDDLSDMSCNVTEFLGRGKLHSCRFTYP